MSWAFNPFTGTLDFTQDAAAETGVAKLTDEYIANENISALRVVKLIDENTCELADSQETYLNAKAVGISVNSGTVGATITTQTFGIIEDASFNFTLNEPLFLTANGIISETAETTGFSVQIGHSLGNGAIFINIREPIEL